MVNYQNGKIYKISSVVGNVCYYGSTCEKLNIRYYKHKYNYKKFQEGNKLYVSSYEVLKYEDNIIELVENFPCNTKKELHIKEGEYIISVSF